MSEELIYVIEGVERKVGLMLNLVGDRQTGATVTIEVENLEVQLMEIRQALQKAAELAESE